MAKFYGEVHGQRGAAHRLGHTSIQTVAASWQGSVQVHLWEDSKGRTMRRVCLAPWRGIGINAELYNGPVDEAPAPRGWTHVEAGQEAEV